MKQEGGGAEDMEFSGIWNFSVFFLLYLYTTGIEEIASGVFRG